MATQQEPVDKSTWSYASTQTEEGLHIWWYTIADMERSESQLKRMVEKLLREKGMMDSRYAGGFKLVAVDDETERTLLFQALKRDQHKYAGQYDVSETIELRGTRFVVIPTKIYDQILESI